MNGVIRPSVSPGSSQRLTSVTCTPTTSVPSGGAAHAGASAARRARTTSPSSRLRRPGGSGAGERIDVLHALGQRSEEHTSELQSLAYLVCRLLLEKKKKKK